MKTFLYYCTLLLIGLSSRAQDPDYPPSPGAPVNITAAEYFIDTDPGIGRGIPVPVSAAINIPGLAASVNVTGLGNGLHWLYIRTRDAAGHWSITNMRDFLYDAAVVYTAAPVAAQNIVSAEYFIDTDPGFGNATPITISPGLDLNNVPVSVTTTGVSNGIHRLYIRTRSNEGRWSLTHVKDFSMNFDFAYPASSVAAQNIVAAEYFIDTDPGFGNGTAIGITAATDISNIPVAAVTTGLAIGTHRLYLRTKSNEGRWSLTQVNEFIVDASVAYPAAPPAAQNITAAEYFIDTDPGFGMGTAITVTPGLDLSNMPVAVNTTGLTNGDHHVYLRTKNQEGAWSLTNEGSFLVGQLTASWTLSPATGHDYGMVQSGSSGVFNFTIKNTGTLPVALGNVVLGNPAFTAQFTPGVSIAVNDSLTLPVTFIPTGSASYSAQVKIVPAAAGPDTVTTTVRGNGFVPGTPPVLSFVSAAPYSNTRGVSAEAGQPGLYTYRVLYTSASNTAPKAGFPQLGIDRNGDHDFLDAGDGLFSMSKADTSTNYAAGVMYTYTVSHPDYSNTLGYRFFATDSLGNVAVSVKTAYTSGPVITYQLPDLKIFASDISFSKNNPLVNEAFTLTANVTNASAYTMTNVPVRFYRDTILLDSAVIPVINGFSVNSISKVFSFAADGYYPIKVWIDSSNTLGDANPLNNYAIRPVIVGTVTLPGGIHVTTTALLQSCPQAVLISGNAQYFGTSVASQVAGAQVTIIVGGQTHSTTTNANGDYSLLLQSPACGGTLSYTVQVTDFTFTSSLANGSIGVPCPSANACVITPQPGVSVLSRLSNAPCGKKAGTTGTVEISVTYRARNLDNFWNGWDQILKDTIKVYHNGVLIETLISADGTTSPGTTRVLPVTITLDTAGPHVIEARQSYVYNEFFDIPGAFYHGMMIDMTGYGNATILADANNPDLTIRDYRQTGFTSFEFADANIKCGDAGSHIVHIYDSIPGGSYTLIKADTVTALGGTAQKILPFSDPNLPVGKHFIRIVTDVQNAVVEADENNNVFETSFEVPKPDLKVTFITLTVPGLPVGGQTRIGAHVFNTGMPAGAFKVLFKVNGVQVGNKITVAGVGAKDSISVLSDIYTATTSPMDCPLAIEVVADVDDDINESVENNNTRQLQLGVDFRPYQLAGEPGAAGSPAIARLNTNTVFHPMLRNTGSRNSGPVIVKYSLNGVTIGVDSMGTVRAGEAFASPGVFNYSFAAPGDYVVKVTADTLNTSCEDNEANNEGNFHIRVVDTNPDFEVLSQYISPGSLNPNLGQFITIVGTVKNTGLKTSQPNVLRFMVDDVQLGADVAFNALQPGQDTTIAATAVYASATPGAKVMKIMADPANTAVEEREDNNEATRALIVGEAPDMARSHAGAISFNPSGFRAGDSVDIRYSIKNNGAKDGTAWVRFLVFDAGDALTAIDSVPFSLAAGASATISKKMLIDADKGMVVAQIVGCTPMEFDLLNNNDTLAYSTVVMLKSDITVSGDLDMEDALPAQLPGWIGGKLVLGDYNLVVQGRILHFDTAHFVITNGNGRLRLVNSNPVNIFPVGVSLYNTSFVTLSNTGTPDNFSVRVAPNVLKNGTGGDTLRTAYVNRTWLIGEDVPGGSNATVEFTWNTVDEQPGFDRLLCKAAHYTSAWQMGDVGAAVADAFGRFSKTQAGYTSFSPFTVTSASAASLPLHLLRFEAVKQGGNNALLQWETTDEINTSRFVVQHSTDGQRFEDIGVVRANNSPGSHQYQLVHNAVTGGPHYYRLKMVDIDDKFTVSGVKMLVWETLQALQVYPNPAQRFISVKGIEANGILQLVTAEGRTVRQLVTKGGGMTIDLGGLPGGIYIILYYNHGKAQQQKIMKE